MLIQRKINLRLSDSVRNILHKSTTRKVTIFKSKSGLDSARREGFLVHSEYDPLREAIKIVDSMNLSPDNEYVFVVLGVGLGYIVDVLGEKFLNSTVIPVELDDDLALAFISRGYDFVVTRHNKNEIFTIFNFIDFLTVKDVKIVEFFGSYRFHKDEYNSLSKEILEVIKSKFSDLITKVNFDKLWIKNAILNLPKIISCGSITRDIFDTYYGSIRGKPAVVFGAGYSGCRLLEVLKDFRSKYVLYTVDTALSTLMSSGIMPDFVFSLDSQLSNLKDFYGTDTSNLTLIADVVVSPGITYNHTGNLFFSKTSHIEVIDKKNYEFSNEFVLYLEKNLNYTFLGLESGGSVSTNLLHLSMLMESSHIFLIGIDLGYPYLVSHLPGSPHHQWFVSSSSFLNTTETHFFDVIFRDFIELRGVSSEKCVSHKIMEVYKTWFESIAKTADISRVVNISDGVFLEGFNNIPVIEAERYLRSFFQSRKEIIFPSKFTLEKPNMSTGKLKTSLVSLTDVLESLRDDLSLENISGCIKHYPFVLNIFSKSLFPFFRGTKNFEEVIPDLERDISYFQKLLKFVIRTF